MAEAQSPAPLVTVRIKKGDARDFVLLGRTARELRLQPPSGGGQVIIPLDTVEEMKFTLPATYAQMQQAYAQGQWAQVVTLLKPIVAPMLPYIDVPGNNAAALVQLQADALRRAGNFEESLQWLKPLTSLSDPAASRTAILWSAYDKVALNKLDEARGLLEQFGKIDQTHKLFALDRLVRAKIFLVNQDYQAAIDAAGQSMAFSPIESEWYAETLYVSAACYEHLTNATSVAGMPVTNKPYRSIVTNLYAELTALFPESTWAKDIEAKLQKEPVATEAVDALKEDEQ